MSYVSQDAFRELAPRILDDPTARSGLSNAARALTCLVATVFAIEGPEAAFDPKRIIRYSGLSPDDTRALMDEITESEWATVARAQFEAARQRPGGA